LVREYTRRWERSWACIVLLGVAYGIIEEGLAAKSFFDPNWMDLGILGTYGRWLNINWVWAQGLSVYHALVSITAPIILAQLTFPAMSEARWLGRKPFIGAHAWFAAVVIFCYALITDFRPNMVQITGCILAVAILACVAKKRTFKVSTAERGASAKKLYLLSLLMMITFFPLIYWIGAYVVASPMVLFIIGLAACTAFIKAFGRWGRGQLSESQLLGIAGGIVTPWIFLSPLQEVTLSNQDSTVGMSAVGIAYAAYVIFLSLQIRRRRQVGSRGIGTADQPIQHHAHLSAALAIEDQMPPPQHLQQYEAQYRAGYAAHPEKDNEEEPLGVDAKECGQRRIGQQRRDQQSAQERPQGSAQGL